MHRNGGGWATHLLNGRFTRLNWEVKNDILTMGYGRSWAPPGPLFQTQRWLQEKVGWHPWIIWADDWHVLDVTQNEIKIQPGSGAVEIMSLRRIN
jgi:hypothetical protein